MAKEREIRDMVERLRTKATTKENITFRISKDVITKFKASCEKSGVKPGATIEELMLLFINAKK
jgi:hypothetical protein